MTLQSSTVPSPCTGVCRIGADGLCEGCRRTLREIADWPALDEAERGRIVHLLHARSPGGSVR